MPPCRATLGQSFPFTRAVLPSSRCLKNALVFQGFRQGQKSGGDGGRRIFCDFPPLILSPANRKHPSALPARVIAAFCVNFTHRICFCMFLPSRTPRLDARQDAKAQRGNQLPMNSVSPASAPQKAVRLSRNDSVETGSAGRWPAVLGGPPGTFVPHFLPHH